MDRGGACGRTPTGATPVALHAWIDRWSSTRAGNEVTELDAIRVHLKEYPVSSVRILEERTAPPEPDEEPVERMERDHEHPLGARPKPAAKRNAWRNGRTWRDESCWSDPDDAHASALGGESRKRTVALNLYAVVQRRSIFVELWRRSPANLTSERIASGDIWDKDALAWDRARPGLRRPCRKRTSERSGALLRPHTLVGPARSTRKTAFSHGLDSAPTGRLGRSHSDSRVDGSTLSPPEARTAVAYATIELNGFAPFITDAWPSRIPRK